MPPMVEVRRIPRADIRRASSYEWESSSVKLLPMHSWSDPIAPYTFAGLMAKHYAESVTSLITALDSNDQRAEAQELLRSLISRIVIGPNAATGACKLIYMEIWQAFSP